MKKQVKAKKKSTVKKKAASTIKKSLGIKVSKPAKKLSEEQFRAEVRNYLATGQSNVLTLAEKVKLDSSRSKSATVTEEKVGFFASIFNWLKN